MFVCKQESIHSRSVNEATPQPPPEHLQQQHAAASTAIQPYADPHGQRDRFQQLDGDMGFTVELYRDVQRDGDQAGMPRVTPRKPLRDPRHDEGVTLEEARRFWAEQKRRAEQMPHIGPRRAHDVIKWMKVTPGWSLEDYDEYFADLHRCGRPPAVTGHIIEPPADRA